MQQVIRLLMLGSLAGNASAHVANDMPLLQHAPEHAWLILALLPLLLLLRPSVRRRKD
jgi:hypothetical protein